ncbi:hypothetical protein [Actinomadura harenae]|uniref:Uncharacterized protein n=1 Tax=Actinomadura harenae TaxID=2483351 RepID=A0A3M2LKS4_9ACTN|nr:hypothetical protein [Actinomadura harenae]RMI37726.1 hypothetical protein EBO15_35010 [Actinomadura harenae]
MAEPLLRSIVLAICDLPRAQQVVLALAVGLDWSPDRISARSDQGEEEVQQLLALAGPAIGRNGSMWMAASQEEPPRILAPLVKSYLRWAGERLLEESEEIVLSEESGGHWPGTRDFEPDRYAFPLPYGPEWEVFLKDVRTS